MKLTKKQIRQLIRESMHDSAWFQSAPEVVKTVYNQGSPDQFQKKFGENPRQSKSEPGIHPSRQLGTGGMQHDGVEYWEQFILKRIKRQGQVNLDDLLDDLAGEDSNDLRDSMLADLMGVVSQSEQIELDDDNNLYFQGLDK